MVAKSRLTIILATLVAFYGCDGQDELHELVAPEADAVAPAVMAAGGTNAASTARDLARAFALSMAEPEVRMGVRDAMRASLVTEHKLVLQEYVKTQSGRLLIQGAADAYGSTPDAVRGRIARLPEMDFYVPFREHRRNWTATDHLAVVATMDVDDPHLSGWTPSGQNVSYDTRNGPPKRAILLLQPAERKSRRIHPQPPGRGSVIQDAGDGEVSGSVEFTTAKGNRVVVQLADLVSGW